MSGHEAFLAGLHGIVGGKYAITDLVELEPYLSDWRGRYRGEALAAVKPANTAEVAAVVRLCAAHGVAVVPQGGNTGLCGGATPIVRRPSIVLRLDRINKVRNVSAIDETITVDAGCILAEIQAAAAGVERMFPLSLGAEGSCQIGGNVSTNAGGIAVLRYGSMRHLVLGIEAVLPDGTVFDGLRRLRKDNAGYDLKQLFIGAEGTLGIVTGVVLKLFPRVRQRSIAMMQVASVADALSLFDMTRDRFGERVSSFEIIGASYMDFVLRWVPNTHAPFQQRSDWFVLVEIGDSDPAAELRPGMERLMEDALERGLISDAVLAASLAQEEALWHLRHGVTGEFRLAGKTMSHDTSVPLSEQPAFTNQVRDGVLAAFPDADVMMVGHIGDGNIHVVVLFPHEHFPDPTSFEAASEAIDVIIDDVAMRLGGSITAEHGVGYTYRRRLARTKTPFELRVMQAIKSALDPAGLMNPGKVLLPADV